MHVLSLSYLLMWQWVVVGKLWFSIFVFLFSVIQQGAHALGGQDGGNCREVSRTNSRIWCQSRLTLSVVTCYYHLSMVIKKVPLLYGDQGKKNAAKLWCAAMVRTLFRKMHVSATLFLFQVICWCQKMRYDSWSSNIALERTGVNWTRSVGNKSDR